MIPQNEMGVVILFTQRASEAGITILEISAAFPDARIKKGDREYLIEFEYTSSNFFNHRHDIRKCDLIVCWVHNSRLPNLPVIELRNDNWVSEAIKTITDQEKEILYWMHRARSAESKLSSTPNCEETDNRWNGDGSLKDAIFSLLEAEKQIGPREMSRRVGCAPSTAKTHIDRWKVNGNGVTR